MSNVVDLSEAILTIFRDEGARGDRQQARLMWLIEKKGLEAFRAQVEAEMAGYGRGAVLDKAQPVATTEYTRRELLGVHAQPTAGLSRVGICVPSGRLSVTETRALAQLADTYSAGELRFTVEQNVILPNVADAQLPALLAEPALNGGRLSVEPGNIAGGMVSCTGAQFCGLGLIETKGNAERISNILEATMTTPKKLRIHWTGCPNSCAQVQAADIGIMGAPAKRLDPVTGKNMAVPGCKIFIGGKIGEDSHLSLEPVYVGVPLDELLPKLEEIIIEHFDGKRCGGTSRARRAGHAHAALADGRPLTRMPPPLCAQGLSQPPHPPPAQPLPALKRVRRRVCCGGHQGGRTLWRQPRRRACLELQRRPLLRAPRLRAARFSEDEEKRGIVLLL